MSVLAELVVAADAPAWQKAGFVVDGGCCRIGRVTVRFVDTEGGEGAAIRSWGIAGAPDETVDDVDGLPTSHVEPGAFELVDHPLGVQSIDHLVVMTGDAMRTARVVERLLGVPLRRTRESDAAGRSVVQAFFRLGEVILEIVGPPPDRTTDEPARFWGLALTVVSMDRAAEHLGPELLGPARPAVQAGRSIATIRDEAALGVPVALMSAG